MKLQPLRFQSAAYPENTFFLSRLEGTDRLSGLYRYELNLLSKDANVDFGKMLKSRATVELDRGVRRGDTVLHLPPVRIHGRLESFEATGRTQDSMSYRAVLVPRVSKLALTWRSRVFLGKTVEQMAAETLTDAEFSSRDYEFRLGGKHGSREYVVQYEESDWDFLSRWLEHEGIFYFFEQGETGEKIVFADGIDKYASLGDDPFPFRPDLEGDTDWYRVESVFHLGYRQEAIPQKVILKDYNWRQPSVDLTVSADVDPAGEGTVFEYNNHYKTKEEGTALAKIRAEEIRSREKTFTGAAGCRAFRAGATWKLSDHFRRDFEIRYLLTEVTHRASLSVPLEGAARAEYANEFRAIPADRAFRPRRATPWPSIKGAMHAKIDAAGSGEYAEVDEHGQYKVRLPIDLSNPADGKASRYVRMAQPYAGSDHGMHFPLHKGTEVLLTHIDGDPDRPVISGAVPNAETASIIHQGNHTKSGFKTSGGNEVAIEDSDGHQRIHLRAGTGKSAIYVGAGSGDRIDISSPWTGMAGGVGSLFSTMLSDTTGALSAAITSGFLKAQLGLWALRSATDITGSVIGAYLPGGDKPWEKKESDGEEKDPYPLMASTLMFLVGKLASALIMKKIVLPNLQRVIKKNSLAQPRIMKKGRWYNIIVHAQNLWTKFLSKFATTEDFGAYLVRCGGGTRLQLNGVGENILLASETGKIVVGGHDTALLAEESLNIHAQEVSLAADKNHLVLNSKGTLIDYSDHHLTITDEGVEIWSPKNLIFFSGDGPWKKLLGRETFCNLTPDQIDLSGKDEASIHSGDNNVILNKKAVMVNCGTGDAMCGIQFDDKGTVNLFGKKLEFHFESISMGDSTTDLALAGKSVKIESQTSLALSSGGPATLNGSAISVLPKPPPPKPPKKPANIAKALEILGIKIAPGAKV